MKFRLIFLIFLIPFGKLFGQEIPEKELISAIQAQNIELLRLHLNSSNVNKFFHHYPGNPLLYAIETNAGKSAEFLLSIGADPNIDLNSRTPLMLASQKQDIRMVKLLIKHEANINSTDTIGNTALMIASTGNKLNIVKLLIRHGAALNLRNKKGLNARDFAVRSNNKTIAVYLKNVFERKLPDYFDGPYISFVGRKKIKMLYLKHDSLRKRSDDFYLILKLNELNGSAMGFAGDQNQYQICTKFERPPTEVNGVKKLLIIGDVHGQFDTLSLFLKNNRVVDEKLRWTFGNGTLVFMGDIFDRGDKVTETLWLIYRLEKEAALQGGSVHFILGNHEMMIFNEDERYIAEKYFYLFRNLKLSYSKQFSSKSLLGKWLRSKNAYLKIDSLLFVHGGIHLNFLNFKLSLDSANVLINRYVNAKKKNTLLMHYPLSFILSYNGPFWYRGMVEQLDDKQITDEEVDQILTEYNVKHIIVGHTFKREIQFINEGRIISTDVPFYLPDGFAMQGLLVEDRKFVILNSQGHREQIDLNNIR